MSAESIIQNWEKIVLDETRSFCPNDVAEKAFYKMLEKFRNLDFSELIHDEKAFDKMLEKLETPPELAAYVKDNFVVDPFRSHEATVGRV